MEKIDPPVTKLFDTDEDCINYLIKHGVLPKYINCPQCQKILYVFDGNYRCKKDKFCRSYLTGSFFENCKISPHKILLISYYYLMKTPSSSICEFLNLTKITVSFWKRKLQKLICQNLPLSHTIIGGEGITVEIDESLFGKIKYHRGKLTNGQWVVGGVERTEERKCFFVLVEKRDTETLQNIISQLVLPGSIVVTDCWAPYNAVCDTLDLDHLTVNHQ